MARGAGWGWQVQVPQTQVLTELKRGPETPADAPQGLIDVKPAGLAAGPMYDDCGEGQYQLDGQGRWTILSKLGGHPSC